MSAAMLLVPITLALGLGPSAQCLMSERVFSMNDDGYRAVASVRADAGYRVTSYLSIGIHAGVSSRASATGVDYFIGDPANPGSTYPMSYHTSELGLAAQLALGDRGWVTPWLGKIWEGSDDKRYVDPVDLPIAWGLDAGFDVLVDGDHRASAFASLSHAGAWSSDPASTTDTEGVTSFTLGVAYRFR
jgi:hypothetical protein